MALDKEVIIYLILSVNKISRRAVCVFESPLLLVHKNLELAVAVEVNNLVHVTVEINRIAEVAVKREVRVAYVFGLSLTCVILILNVNAAAEINLSRVRRAVRVLNIKISVSCAAHLKIVAGVKLKLSAVLFTRN